MSAVASCSDKNSDSSTDDSVNTTTAPTEPSTLPEPPQEAFAQTLTMAEGVYIYDNAKVLSQEDFSNCNNYAEWLYKNCFINVAVVTTDSIGDMTPAKYAETSYNDLYGNGGNGLLLLINNDTNEDYLFKTGACSYQISQDDEASAFYTATAEIINGDYKSAILRLLGLGEASQFVLDEAGVFLDDHFTDLETLCSQSQLNCSVVATGSSGAITTEQLCRSYYDRKYKDGSGVMIMLDTSIPSLTVVSDGLLPDNLNDIIAEAETAFETDGYHSGGYHSAIRYIITQLEGA
ncbi:MAG: TPM domain-containing protein [Ruminococcus sp.]|nr:TPM domain-containing protein [Ruminococcus sp.]